MRGQIVIEFLSFVAIAIIVAMLYLGVSGHLLRDTSEQQRLAALNDIGFRVQDEVILATSVADGYSRRFTIPDSADRFPYEITNDVDTVTLTSAGVAISYLIPDVSGTFQKGMNTIVKDGTIEVNP